MRPVVIGGEGVDAQGGVDFPHPGPQATRRTSISSSKPHNPQGTSTQYATGVHGAAIHTRVQGGGTLRWEYFAVGYFAFQIHAKFPT